MAGVSECCIGLIGLFAWLYAWRSVRRERKRTTLLVLYLYKEHQNILVKGRGAAVLQLLEIRKRMRRVLTGVDIERYITLPKRGKIRFRK